MKLFIITVAAVSNFLMLSTASALSLELENQSNWAIHELYFSPGDEKSWGPDQLEEQVIEHGETFQLRKISKGNYDVKIVDEDGDSCEITDVDFTSSEHFVLTEKLLLGCQSATAEEHEESEE